MKKASFRWEVLLIAPVVGAILLGALWVSIAGALADRHFAHFADQLLEVVATARDMRVDPRAESNQATDWLWDRLSTDSGSTFEGDKRTHSVTNVWGGGTKLTMVPAGRQLWIETPIPAQVCYRALVFIDKTRVAMGVRRILLRQTGAVVDWRQLYDVPDPQQTAVDPRAIKAGCGGDEPLILGVLFQLY